jgi:outer membrane lipoprotein-sorting protein
MFRIAGFSSAAAAVIVAALAATLWIFHQNGPRGFAQVVERVQKSKTVSFVIKQKLGQQPELETKMYIEGEQFRYEIPDILTLIVDANRRQGIELYPNVKVAKRMSLEGRLQAEALKDPIDRLRNLPKDIQDHVERLPDEKLNGLTCHVYRVKGRVKEAAAWMIPDQFTLWADAKTGLPVKIHAQDENTSLTYEQFKWDEQLKADLFSLEVPKGYRLEELTPAVIQPGRIYYHQEWIELHSVQRDGQKPEVQFVPRSPNPQDTYVSDRAELSPDGRFMAIAYTHSTKEGSFPPYRVLLWDRTRPKEEATEIYARPEGELQFWQFSPDGQRLYVSWWQGIPGRKGPEGRYGADVVDLKTKAKQTLTLPKYKDADGKEKEMLFATATADGQTYLVVGQGLYETTAEGELGRRLTAPEARIGPSSVRLSPDGKQAVYATALADKSQQLFVVSLADGEARELVPAGKFIDLRARWSPDGKRIAYTCRLFDPSHPPFYYGTETLLKVVDPNGSNVATLLKEKVHPKGPSLKLTAWR